MKRIQSIIILIITMTVTSVHAQNAGIFGSYVGFNFNSSTTESWYGAQEWGTDMQNLHQADLGQFNWQTGPNSLVLNKFTIQTFKSNGGDVTGASLLYRVYEQGTTPLAFNTVNANFLNNAPFTGVQGSSTSGGGDQNWGRDPVANASSTLANVNLLTSISVTNLTTFNVEFYFEAATSLGTRVANNSGTNYIATFKAIPEPSSASLIALGTAGLIALRRRRNA